MRGASLVALTCAVAVAVLVRFSEQLLSQLPSHFEPVGWADAPPLPSLAGSWSPNSALSGAELQTWNGTALAPECFAEDGSGAWYASVAFGVVRVPPAPTQPAAPVFFTPAATDGWRGPLERHPLYDWCFAQASAGNTSSETTCGRPLGLRVVNSSDLYVADAYFGIFRVALGDESGAPPTWLVKPEDASPAMRFFNDLDVAADGAVYFTDSSWRYTRRQNRLEIIENAALARLFVLRAPGAPLQLLSRGHFLNGVQLTRGGAELLVVELGRLRVLRCALPVAAGDTCAMRVFADALPGVPDNIRLTADGTALLVGCATKVARPFSALLWLWAHPGATRALGVLLSRLPLPAAMQLLERAVPSYGLVLRLSLDGTPAGSLQDPSGRVRLVAGAHETRDGALWLGSATNRFAARVPPPPRAP